MALSFFFTLWLVFIIYAGFTSMTPVWTWSGLTANAWNQMIDNLNTLKTTSDTLSTTASTHTSQISTLQTQVNAINTSWSCPAWKSMIDFSIYGQCMANNVPSITAGTTVLASAKIVNWVLQTRIIYPAWTYNTACDSWRINWYQASCNYSATVFWSVISYTATATANITWVCYSTTCKTWN